ncbi:hypothetical protein Asphe3_32420 [Pseudarthrobacter phenanthrenivorans Sphe3]|uniref:Peptidase C39-like domain-containing protein n=1 Tax=Pseudarthrobacter phenanthrenivorans (strain DSM 18606 / JCM 16027 / LMG 23796 / Sphe3) TaxID=930171 RepID=F0M2T8_PSEPM|nr:hypothetical protein [Pseudarthrobacter phenanthrenivorans]ADX74350.1 hypothetical protein Asphe3_32420 [Pseudarthrobacter phenanthrenivorans Sphe3]
MADARHPRLLAWLVVLATFLGACTPAVGIDDAATGPAPQTSAAQPSPSAADPGAQGAAVPVPAATATTTAAPVPTTAAAAPPPPPVPQAFALNLYQEGDFVPQYTFDWCVAASIQIAHNLIDDTGGGTWTDSAQQGELWEMARARSSNSFNGANPLGWAQVLTEVGLGPYKVVSVAGYQDALQTAARAITETGRPVGLVMWSGRHAWVMSGFESVGDPALFPEFSVTGIRVQDPLYPHGSGQWGPSPAPNSLLTPEELATQFVVREPRRWSSQLPAGYLLVLPVAAA